MTPASGGVDLTKGVRSSLVTDFVIIRCVYTAQFSSVFNLATKSPQLSEGDVEEKWRNCGISAHVQNAEAPVERCEICNYSTGTTARLESMARIVSRMGGSLVVVTIRKYEGWDGQTQPGGRHQWKGDSEAQILCRGCIYSYSGALSHL